MSRLTAYERGVGLLGAAVVALTVWQAAGADVDLARLGLLTVGWTVARWLAVAFVTGGANRTYTAEEVFAIPVVVLAAPSVAVLAAGTAAGVAYALSARWGDGVTRAPRRLGRFAFAVGRTVVPAAAAAGIASWAGVGPAGALAAGMVFTVAEGAMMIPAYAMVEDRGIRELLWLLAAHNWFVPVTGWFGGVLLVAAVGSFGPLVPTVAAVVIVVGWWALARRLYYAESITSGLLDVTSRLVEVDSRPRLDELVRTAGERLVDRPLSLTDEPSGAVAALELPRAEGLWLAVGERHDEPRPLQPHTERALQALAVTFGTAVAAIRARRELAHQASHDRLTGLPNRYGLREEA